MERKIGAADIVLFLLLLVLAALLFWRAFAYGKSGETVEITLHGKPYGVYALSEDRVILVEDPDRDAANIVEISGGKVHMSEADCPDKLCVRQGEISRDRQTIVCLPNQVIVTVYAAEESGFDAVAE